MLFEIGIAIGVALSLIGLLDLALSASQKEAINILATRLWNEADEINKLSFDERLTHRVVTRVAIVAIGLMILLVFYNEISSDPLMAASGFSGFFFAVWVGPYVFAWAKNSALRFWILGGAALGAMIGGESVSHSLGFAAFMMTCYYLLIRVIHFGVLIICAYSVSGVEFILRRVAEYPKRVVAAVGIILTFISTLAKLFTGT
jgi:hypothetical protein